jgi:putative spermidine/putrescine transport system ATP-binding protein
MAPSALPLASVGGLGVRLDVARGEFFTLLGPAGAGKSALLAVLAGFAPAAGRDVLLDGRPIGRTPPHRRGIGLVEAGTTLLPHLTVAENIALPLRLRGTVRAQRLAPVAELLDRLGLTGRAGRLPQQLSPEQTVRAALARALAAAPKLLLLDDPLALLDRAARTALQFDLRRLHAALGLTVLHATRDAAEALLLADRVGVLGGGRLHQIGPPQVLYDEPTSALVAGVLGEANFLPGLFVAEDDDLADIQLDCGIAVQARPIDAVRGQRCVVAVRPERIALATVSAEEMGDGALPATVQDVLPQGDHIRLRLIVGAPGAPATLLTVHRPAGAPLAGLHPGASAAVAWQPYHANALRPERSGPP